MSAAWDKLEVNAEKYRQSARDEQEIYGALRVRLYTGMSTAFVMDTVRNQISRKLSDAFFSYYGYPPAKSEIAAWGKKGARICLGITDIHARTTDY